MSTFTNVKSEREIMTNNKMLSTFISFGFTINVADTSNKTLIAFSPADYFFGEKEDDLLHVSMCWRFCVCNMVIWSLKSSVSVEVSVFFFFCLFRSQLNAIFFSPLECRLQKRFWPAGFQLLLKLRRITNGASLLHQTILTFLFDIFKNKFMCLNEDIQIISIFTPRR